MTEPMIPALRLSFREEGVDWIVYAAKPDTMDDAYELGRIRIGVIERHPDIREAFMDLFKTVLRRFFEDQGAEVSHFIEMAPPGRPRQ